MRFKRQGSLFKSGSCFILLNIVLLLKANAQTEDFGAFNPIPEEPKKEALKPPPTPAPSIDPEILKQLEEVAEPQQPSTAPGPSVPAPVAPAPQETAETAAQPMPTQEQASDERPVSESSNENPNKDQINERVLESPTQSVEAYEKERRKLLTLSEMPDWGMTLNFAYRAFSNADLRVSNTSVGLGEIAKPRLSGLHFGFEKIFLRSLGYLALGAELGGYGSPPRNRFDGLLLAFQSAGPYVMYQANYFSRQWLVPALRAQYEIVRYSYTFLEGPDQQSRRIRGLSMLPRLDIGLLLFLNIFEPTSAGGMKSSWGVKRTYLGAFYSIAQDSKKKNFNLSENGLRVGLRFEM
ncbi:MAG: hypothetical protein AB1540_14680 [Bdellovibrionota bacterium]